MKDCDEMNILILGVSGMLGHTLFKYFSSYSGYNVRGTVRSKSAIENYYTADELTHVTDGVDANMMDTIIDAIGSANPDIIINCIGVIKQLESANDPLTCLNINSVFPHKLAKLAAVANARVIHISTDCVFDGKDGNYAEGDVSNAYDLYGRTKFLGELTSYPQAITLRTSIIGHELNKAVSLVDWFLSQKTSVNGYTKAIYSGLPTIELARVIHEFVIPRNDLAGLYHVSSAPVDKFTLLKIIAEVYDKKIEIIAHDAFQIDRSLDSSKFQETTGYSPPDWSSLVKQMHEEYIAYHHSKRK